MILEVFLCLYRLQERFEEGTVVAGKYDVVVTDRICQEVVGAVFQIHDDLCSAQVAFVLVVNQLSGCAEGS